MAVVLAVASRSQSDSNKAANDQDDAKNRTAWDPALTAWLTSDHRDAGVLDRAVVAILDAGAPAIVEVGRQAKTAQAKSDGHAGRGLDAVITHVAVGYLKRESSSGMVHEGQYAALAPLQPFVGKLFLQLLLDTPDWFSADERHLLVFPLRDVYPESPGKDVCERLRAVATDGDSEPEGLRKNLAFALAQWGDRSLIDARIAQVTKDSTAADLSDDRRAALRYELADIHYQLREYARAAQIHVEMLRQAETRGTDLLPTHYYNAACCLARAGAGAAALDELQRAADVMRSGRIDPSAMLQRRLFERDPDLASVRASDRFRAIFRAAFGDAGAEEPAARRKDG
jgi:hypothetical protein